MRSDKSMSLLEVKNHYIMTPTEELVKLLDKHNYPQDSWREKMIWEMPAGHALDASDLARNSKFVRISLLLSIISLMRTTAVKEKYAYLAGIVYEMFGNPPQYDVETLDRWWTMEHTDSFYEYSYYVGKAKAEDFQQIKKTGDVTVDKWLERYAKSDE